MKIPDRDDLVELRAELRRMIDRDWPIERARRQLEPEATFDVGGWHRLVESGLAGVLAPEELGGIDAGLTTAEVFAGELGRRLVPSPFLPVTLATSALVEGYSASLSRSWVPRLADGSAVASVALTGTSGSPAVRPEVVASRCHDGWVLNGAAGFVPYGAEAQLVIVAVGTAPPMLVGVEFPADGVRVEPRLMHDRTQPLADLHFRDVKIPADAVIAADAHAERLMRLLLLRGAILRAADAAGAARVILDEAVAYAKQRRQFDRPIGSFQAVKHKLADMHVRAEGAAAAARGAAAVLDGTQPGEERRVALAASYALEAFVSIAGDAIQVHGGMGYTWEHDCHMYLKRAELDEALLGDAAWLRAQAADAIFASP